jgi:transcription-repair coupling factor (superfamily II helicase)
MEHWLPLFYAQMETLFDYVPNAVVVFDHRVHEALEARWEIIADHHAARVEYGGTRFADAAAPYHPVPPERMFLLSEAWDAALAERDLARLSPFAAPEVDPNTIDFGGRPGATFAEARVRGDVNVFDALADRLKDRQGRTTATVFAAASNGTRDRLLSVLQEHGISGLMACETWADAKKVKAGAVAVVVLPLEQGFVAKEVTVIAEPDVLGDRLTRHTKRRKRPDNFLKEATALAAGDLVVHIDHGIGRYDGLETISVGSAPHDCLKLTYANENRLYLPVENIEMITRYGSETDGVTLDRLGGAAWQARKAKLKDRVKEMAGELINLAAARTMRKAPMFSISDGAFDEFCARFPYTETDDQNRAIGDVLQDLGRGSPADRLICGDVGFGKTEVALRAAFIAALEGKQVAVVVPTTLLCRQHYRNFEDRFRGFPMRIAELSRLVTPRDVKAVKTELANGTIDIVIGTHAILAKDISFRDLGLLIVDEEQHFGVAHKERLKKLKADIHVLTLTATPIPRTLQMALTGVRDMSLIATPPVDRLAVRTFVTEVDPVVIREALIREHYRGGQSFYVCPRIEDLSSVQETLAELTPELSVVVAHGRMRAKDLEDAIAAFYDGRFNILLSTNIIESGLDLPSVNTIIIHRADMFGLGQLYQLRGRVGRGRRRAYAYLTLPPRKKVTQAAEKRLNVMQTLDSLGAGFTLASHDLDIRGAGNLLGSQQSGHIREVGIELYQQMLEEAVAKAQSGDDQMIVEDDWSPQIALGVSVLIPDTYVPDLSVRLGLYRRLADIRTAADIDSFAAELADRFGKLPDEVSNLLEVVGIKNTCRAANIEKVDAGPKGAVVAFRGNDFANPEGLIRFIAQQARTCSLRPDHRLVYKRVWDRPADRLGGVRRLVTDLAHVASGAAEPAVKRA